MDNKDASLASRPRLLAQVRNSLRVKLYSLRTEQSYIYWIRYFIRFHKTQRSSFYVTCASPHFVHSCPAKKVELPCVVRLNVSRVYKKIPAFAGILFTLIGVPWICARVP